MRFRNDILGKGRRRCYNAINHLLADNQNFVDYLQTKGVDVAFEMGPGAHEWDFWDTYIKKAIDWLPTENSVKGINSGNIGRD